jgi:hypothetical protein
VLGNTLAAACRRSLKAWPPRATLAEGGANSQLASSPLEVRRVSSGVYSSDSVQRLAVWYGWCFSAWQQMRECPHKLRSKQLQNSPRHVLGTDVSMVASAAALEVRRVSSGVYSSDSVQRLAVWYGWCFSAWKVSYQLQQMRECPHKLRSKQLQNSPRHVLGTDVSMVDWPYGMAGAFQLGKSPCRHMSVPRRAAALATIETSVPRACSLPESQPQRSEPD